MTNPITDLLALRRAPAALAADLTAITDAMRSVRTIETMLASLLAALDPLLADVERLREMVEPQQERVAHIEQMMQVLEQRTCRDRNHRSTTRIRRRTGAAGPPRSRR